MKNETFPTSALESSFSYGDGDHDDDDDGDGDGDGNDGPTVHSSMRVHECARPAIDLPSWPANWTATLGSTTGHHHWPA